jgi:hypothetical protein
MIKRKASNIERPMLKEKLLLMYVCSLFQYVSMHFTTVKFTHQCYFIAKLH